MESTPRESALAPVAEDPARRLTGRMASGDEEAFREFQQLYFNRLFRHILVLTRGEESEAKEALQETLCRVARYIRPFDREEVFWCWLTRLARSAARDGGRKRLRYLHLLEKYCQCWLPLQAASSGEEEARLEEALAICMTQLEPSDRALVEAKYSSKTSLRELAAQTGLTERAVESRLLRLRRQLRERIILTLRKAGL